MTRRRAAAMDSGDPAEESKAQEVRAQDLKGALLDWLGLPPDASPDDVENAHERLAAFLGSAPAGLRDWARQQATAADAAFAVLSGTAAGATVRTTAGTDEAGAAVDDELDADLLDEDDAPAKVRRPRQRQVGGNRTPLLVAAGRGLRGSRAVAIVLVLVIAGIVYGVYQMGGQPKEATTTAAQATPTPTAQALDRAKVAALTAKLKTEPKDIPTLRSLADVYFQAGEFKSAAAWQQKIIAIAPNDVDARLARGVALFNTGDVTNAEKEWLTVVKINPKQVEAHYDLGFLYLSKSPPDTAKAKAAWQQVVALDPKSDLAKTVSSHLDNLDSIVPSTSATTPAPSTSPAASPPAGRG